MAWSDSCHFQSGRF